MSRFLLTLMLSLSLIGCSRSELQYEPYIQINKTDKPNQNFVLVIAKNPASLKDKFDGAQAHFLLGDGETKSETVMNKNFPTRRYVITATLKRPIVTVTIQVNDLNRQVFYSSQKFASWTGF